MIDPLQAWIAIDCILTLIAISLHIERMSQRDLG